MALIITSIATVKDVQEVFQCSPRTAMRKLKQVRKHLGKKVNNNGSRGADPVTYGQLKDYFKI